ncbi:AI-2E family transporter [Propionicicella superfundia]|uniref:AI-2E family transporter n=1 Tax=Propionicicella superfundia TaxID=348582 RepID=UPI0004130DFA|nr:AI-2E family transporter [Propionicicella superfundia]
MTDQDLPAEGTAETQDTVAPAVAEESDGAPGAAAEPDAVPLGPVPDTSAAADAPRSRRRSRVLIDISHPFRWGFVVTAGALVALAIAGGLSSLSTVLISIGVALFIALALDPVVRWLQSHGMSRGLSIAIVFVGFAVVVAGVLAWLIPVAITQIAQLAGNMPGYVIQVENADWFKRALELFGQGGDVYAGILDQASAWLADPANLLALGGGAVAVGTGAINAFSGTLIVIVLTLYFLATLGSMKRALYSLAPAYARPRLAELTEKVTEAVGSYVAGMVVLAFCNAVFAFLLLTILGIPFAPLLALLALLITMIPMIGPFLFLIIATIICLFHAPVTGLIFAIAYFAYMEVEAYVLTPRVMTRAVDVPGSLVLIGAMVGASLLGLLGALVAVPVAASLLIILRNVYIPRQDARLRPED